MCKPFAFIYKEMYEKFFCLARDGEPSTRNNFHFPTGMIVSVQHTLDLKHGRNISYKNEI